MHADCRYHSHSTGQHLQTFAGQSRGQSIPYQQQDQSSSRSVHAELPAQHALCTVSAAPQQALSELCLQLPLGAHQQQQLQAHLQLHHRYQLDLAAKHLAEQQQQQGSCRAANAQESLPDGLSSMGCLAPSSWSQAPVDSSAGLEGSCGVQDSSATGIFCFPCLWCRSHPIPSTMPFAVLPAGVDVM